MKNCLVTISVAATLLCGAVGQSFAQTLAQQSFDIVLEGDDPGESFLFDLPLDPVLPSAVRFDGFFENRAPEETGARYLLRWLDLDGNQEGVDTDFVRLPASGQVPLQFDHSINFTPDSMRFIVQGGGPADHFRFVGDFTIQQVPEPTASTLAAAGAVIGLLTVRRRRTFRRLKPLNELRICRAR